MLPVKKLSLVSMLVVVAAGSGLAAADHRPDTARIQLGDIATHARDVDDTITVAPPMKLQQLQLRGRGAAIALAGVRIHFTNGSSQFADLERVLRPGETITVDIANRTGSVDSVALEYGSTGKVRVGRNNARIQVTGSVADERRPSRWQRLAGPRMNWPAHPTH